jgi:hypothetical protein
MTRQQWMSIGVAQRESPGWKVTMMLLKPRPALLNADEFRRMQNDPKKWVAGHHFEARKPQDLADTMVQAVSTTGLWDRLASDIRQPPSHEDCAEAHLTLARWNSPELHRNSRCQSLAN